MRIFVTILLTLALMLAGCSFPPAATGGKPTVTRPTTIEGSTTQTSKQGLFTISYKSEVEPVVINQLHTWTLHIEAVSGQPLNSATVTIDGGMPEHNHGMPTQPIVTPLGDGNFRAEGMKFQMPGWWTVTVTVADTVGPGDRVDSATFNLLLK